MFSIQLARQGQTMEKGTLVRWNKKAGEDIVVGEELYEIETEKAIVPIEATRPGRLLKVLVAPGDTVDVGTVLAVAADPGESVSEAQLEAAVRPSPIGDRSNEKRTDSVALPLSPSATPEVVKARKPLAAPKVRALAQELGIDLSRVSGSGEDGAILMEDVRRAASAVNASSKREALSPIARSTIAALERAVKSPQFTQGILVDATNIQRARSASAGKLAYTDFFLDAVVRAAKAVPQILARVDQGEMVYSDSIDISIATTTEAGLLIPVLRNAGMLSIQSRALEWHRLVEDARAGKLGPDQGSGGILALSNLGTRGVDYGTPLLPYGHAAIVFVGALAMRPMVVDEKVEARLSVHVAITFDHRVADGVMASRFTTALHEALLSPNS